MGANEGTQMETGTGEGTGRGRGRERGWGWTPFAPSCSSHPAILSVRCACNRHQALGTKLSGVRKRQSLSAEMVTRAE